MGEETQEDESGLLTIHDVTRAHAGLYQCTANNGIGPPATVDVQLVVQCEFVVFIFGVREGQETYLWGHAHVFVPVNKYTCTFTPVLCPVSA